MIAPTSHAGAAAALVASMFAPPHVRTACLVDGRGNYHVAPIPAHIQSFSEFSGRVLDRCSVVLEEQVATAAATNPLLLKGFEEDGEPVFTFNLIDRTFIDDLSEISRWRIQLGLQYMFN